MITLTSVTYGYSKQKPIFTDLNLTVDRNEFLALLGPNGSGKTTLLYLMAGLLKPQKGWVEIMGQGNPGPESMKGKVALVFQDPDDQLFAPTVFEDVAYGPLNLGLDKTEIRQRTEQALHDVGLWELKDCPPHSLSFGQKKLVALAGALAMRSQVLLLDEPTAGLDPLSSYRMMEMFATISRQAGLCVVMATHDVDIVPLYAERVVVLKKGEIIAKGSPKEVFATPANLRSASLRLPRVSHLFETLPPRLRPPHLPLTIGEGRKRLLEYSYDPDSGRMLRRGYTTGTCAAAAAMGAVAGITGTPLVTASITTPAGISFNLPLEINQPTPKGWRCGVKKDGGGDHDVTHGLVIMAEAYYTSTPGIILTGGPGIGRVTKPGLEIPPGEPAINPVPREMILKAIQPYLSPTQGVTIEISVPGGEKIAKRTMNPDLGIIGGISILGTTGIVEPMSKEAMKSSLRSSLDMVLATGSKRVVLVPGRRGADAAQRVGISRECIAQMGNFVGFMLAECADLGFEEVLLFGHIGKLLKVAGGIFDTHSKLADCRLEIVGYHAARAGASTDILKQLEETVTAEAMIDILRTHHLGEVLNKISQSASARVTKRFNLPAGTILTDWQGSPIGWDEGAVRIGGKLGWSLER